MSVQYKRCSELIWYKQILKVVFIVGRISYIFEEKNQAQNSKLKVMPISLPTSVRFRVKLLISFSINCHQSPLDPTSLCLKIVIKVQCCHAISLKMSYRFLTNICSSFFTHSSHSRPSRAASHRAQHAHTPQWDEHATALRHSGAQDDEWHRGRHAAASAGR